MIKKYLFDINISSLKLINLKYSKKKNGIASLIQVTKLLKIRVDIMLGIYTKNAIY